MSFSPIDEYRMQNLARDIEDVIGTISKTRVPVHWLTYLLEAADDALGETALKEVRTIIDQRIQNGRW